MSRGKLFCSIMTIGLACAGFAGGAYADGPAPVPPAAPAPAATPAPPKPIATTDGETPGLRIDVMQLKRVSGDAVMLRFTVYNNSDKVYSGDSFYGSEGYTTDGVYLVDLDGKKKYLVVKDSEDKCLCSRGIQGIPAHGSAVLWAKFGAPADNVTKLGVVVPHFVPMDDVPLAPR